MLRSRVLIATTSFALLVMAACGVPPEQPADSNLPVRAPAALVKDSEISGVILGLALKQPMGVSSDSRGNVYVVDAGNDRVIKFDPNFKPIGDRGSFGNQQGQFNQPKFVTVDNVLAVLVSDAGNRRIERLDAELNFVEQYVMNDDTDPLKYGAPSGVATTKYGAVWIADYDKNRLVILDNVGTFDKFAADYGATGGQLDHPQKLISDDDDNFYVCDPGNARIAVYDSYGAFTRNIKDPDVIYPVAAAFDSKGYLWVLDQASERVFCFTASGRKITEKGLEVFGLSAPLATPADLTALSNDRLLITDSGDNRLIVCRIILSQP